MQAKGSRYVLLDRRQALLGGALLSLASPLVARPRIKLAAFIVGIDAYTSLEPLTRAVNDAKAMASKVSAYGYDVTLSLNPTVDQLLGAQQEFLGKLGATGAAASFCYFAGHGAQLGGVNFLLPVDVDATSTEKILEGSIQLDDIMSQIAHRAPVQSIVVLDACRNDPAASALPGQGFAAANVPNGFYVVYSTGTGEYAVDNLGAQDMDPNGLFARSLLKHLSPSESFDSVVKQVKGEVAQAAKAIGRSQHPGIFNQTIVDPRLDPMTAPVSAAATAQLGRMHSTVALLVAADTYPDSTLPRLFAPANDIAKLGATLKSLGAETWSLRNPGSSALAEMLAKIARSGVDDILVYYSGMGCLLHNDGAIVVPAKAGTGVSATLPFYEPVQLSGEKLAGTHAITLQGILALLRPPGEPSDAEGTVRGFALRTPDVAPSGVRVTLLMDTNLIEWGVTISKPSGGSALERLRAGTPPIGFGGVAVLYAAGMLQNAVDSAEGSNSSPFAIALNNALTRPGLTLAQLSSVVRTEVEGMTKGKQTPALFATETMRDLILVSDL